VKGDRLYLTHILDAIEKIESYISVGRDVFVSTSHWQDAVIRSSAPNILKSHGAVSRDCVTC